jgi:hypothetical protein
MKTKPHRIGTAQRLNDFSLQVSSLILLLCLSLSAQTTYYIDTAGSDANNGTSPSTPWQTFNHAAPLLTSGSTLILTGGETFAGPLGFTNMAFTSYVRITSSSAANPAIISAGSGAAFGGAIYAYNTPYLQVDNLILTYNTNGAASGLVGGIVSNVGIMCWNSNAASVFTGPVISNCVITNCYSGISLLGWASGGIWSNFVITGNSISNCLDYGLFTGDSNTLAHYGNSISAYGLVTGGYVGHNNIGFCPGYGSPGMIGSPIGLYQASNCLAEYNFLHDSGSAVGSGTSGGAGAFITGYSRNIRCQYSEAAFMHRALNNEDGVGFDWDINSSNITFYACYSHDNDQQGFMGYTTTLPNGSNTICYCLSSNDNTYAGGKASFAYQGVDYGIRIYNNTIVSPSASDNYEGLQLNGTYNGSPIVANNIIAILHSDASALYASGTLPAGMLVNNDYYAGQNVATYNGTHYTTLASFQSGTGQETGTGFAVNPQFVSAPVNGTAWPNPPSSLVAEELAPSSPLIGVAVSLQSDGIAFTNDIRGAPTQPLYSLGAYGGSFPGIVISGAANGVRIQGGGALPIAGQQ